MDSYKNLKVWQKSMDLVEEMYKLTSKFPKEELFGLTSQMRRSTIAIPSNIAEGQRRNHLKEYIQFLYIAKGSGAELETQLLIAKRLSFNTPVLISNAEDLLTEILKMLTKLIESLQRHNKTSNN